MCVCVCNTSVSTIFLFFSYYLSCCDCSPLLLSLPLSLPLSLRPYPSLTWSTRFTKDSACLHFSCLPQSSFIHLPSLLPPPPLFLLFPVHFPDVRSPFLRHTRLLLLFSYLTLQTTVFTWCLRFYCVCVCVLIWTVTPTSLSLTFLFCPLCSRLSLLSGARCNRALFFSKREIVNCAKAVYEIWVRFFDASPPLLLIFVLAWPFPLLSRDPCADGRRREDLEDLQKRKKEQ